MSKEDSVLFSGKVVDALPSAKFKVELENGHIINAIISGRMRKNNIRIAVGDGVDVEISPYDLTIGRITFRK